MCCPLVFEFSVGIGGFVIGLGQISFFFSLKLEHNLTIMLVQFFSIYSENQRLLIGRFMDIYFMCHSSESKFFFPFVTSKVYLHCT